MGYRIESGEQEVRVIDEKTGVLALLKLGDAVASQDYAVMHFLHPWHPRFFGNSAALRKAVRRAIPRRPAAQKKDLQEALSEILAGSALRISESDPEIVGVVLRGMEAMRVAIASLSESQRQDFFSTLAYSNSAAGFSADDEDFLLEQFGYKVCFSDEYEDDCETRLEPIPDAFTWLSCPIPSTAPLSKEQRKACASIGPIAEAISGFLENRQQVRLAYPSMQAPIYLEWLAGQVHQTASHTTH